MLINISVGGKGLTPWEMNQAADPAGDWTSIENVI
jgi:hypothetical protein